MLYKTALLSAVSLSLIAPAAALAADTIVVKGSRLNQTATEIGSSVSIITAEDIDRLGFDFALDALAAAPGVTINSNGAFGGQASVRIRGAATEQTLVLIDGVAVNDVSSTGGGFNFARLDTENIERIEILKGPQSTLWGTDAIGGVVSITTKRPQKGLGGSIFGEYGSFNTFRGGASLENGNETGDIRLAVVGTSSDGISKADEDDGNTEEDAYEALTLSANGGLNLGEDVRLSADILWTDAESEFDNSGGPGGDGDRVSETEELSANIKLTGSLLDGRLDNLALLGYSEITRENFTDGAPSFDAEGDRIIYRYQGTLTINGANTLAFGAEREETSVDDDDNYINGYFALYEFKPLDEITLTGGVRVDDHEEFGTETTGRVAAAYNPTDTLTLRASWGQGFKAPTLFQTTFFCCGATEPNRDLQPETSEGFDVGFDMRSADGRAEAGITYFDQDTENQIDFSFASGDYRNIAEVESQGVEIYGAYQLTDWLSISTSYTYIDAQDGVGNAVVRVPEHSADITVSFDPDGPFSGSLLVRYNGEEQDDADFDDIPDTTLDSWTRVDLTGSYDVNERIELFGRVENLFDEDYQQILGYGTPDLSGYLGVRLRY
ncbi:MAG: TonB-dependent receptor [Pseudomonadota bacterium]